MGLRDLSCKLPVWKYWFPFQFFLPVENLFLYLHLDWQISTLVIINSIFIPLLQNQGCVHLLNTSQHLPACLWLNEGLFCISTLSPTSSPSSLTFYCELLGDWQKRGTVHTLSSLPSTIHPSIAHPCLPPSFEPLHVFAFVSSPFSISNMLSLSSSIHCTDSLSFHPVLLVSG